MNKIMAAPSNNPFFSVCKKCHFRGCDECHGGIKISCGQGNALVLFMKCVFGSEPFAKGYMKNGKITIQTDPAQAAALAEQHKDTVDESLNPIVSAESCVESWSYDSLLRFAIEHEITNPGKGGPIKGRISKTILFPLVLNYVMRHNVKVEKETAVDE